MRKYHLTIIFLPFLFIACNKEENSALSDFKVYCEMVANDAKPIALSAPLEGELMDASWDDYLAIASQYEVEIYREKEFPVTPLFPASATEGKEVVIIYRAPRLVQYEQLKKDTERIDPVLAARRFGRLLGYSPQGINELLMKNTGFRTLNSFGIEKQVTHLYYEDVNEAKQFYQNLLGLNPVGSNRFIISDDAMIQINSFDEVHPEGQEKSTAIAFLTDQLPAWYEHVQRQGIEIKYTYKPRDGGPHDGFVAIDPGGYLLEFEQFKQHPENELFMAYLEQATRIQTKIDDLNFYGSITWTYHNDLLQMQRFYEEELGFQMVADQGWTKIYQTSPTGFMGLVDERRGMMDYADEKAVEIEWSISDSEAQTYFAKNQYWSSETRGLIGPEKYRYVIH